MSHNNFDRATDSERRPDLKFHRIHSNGVKLEHGNQVAVRSGRQGIVFSNRPISIDERVCIQLNEAVTVHSLRWGVTTVDPECFDRRVVLDRDEFIARREKMDYWVPDWVGELSEGSLMQFNVSHQGEIRCNFGRNGELTVLGDVPANSSLWVVVDLCGTATKIEFGNRTSIPLLPLVPTVIRTERGAPPPITRDYDAHSNETTQTTHPSAPPEQLDYALPSAPLENIPEPGAIPSAPPRGTGRSPLARLAMSVLRPTRSRPAPPPHSLPPLPSARSRPVLLPPFLPPLPAPRETPLQENSSDCSICCDAVVNSVLIECGHIVACYECAVRIKNEGNKCPICRQPIAKVYKTFKS